MNENKVIALISVNRGVVVRSLEKGLQGQGFKVIFSDTSMEEVRKNEAVIHIFVVILSENSTEMRKVLTFINEKISRGNRPLVLIGEKVQLETVRASMPGVSVQRFVNRPVEPTAFALDMAELSYEAMTPKVKYTVLVVDDDPLYAGMVSDWLRDDYSVAVVTSGVKALTYLYKKKVDLVLLDYEMPGADGPKVLEMIRAEEDLADTPVVFLTGVSNRQSVQKVMSLKPDGYILKSAGREDLLSWLSDFMSANRSII